MKKWSRRTFLKTSALAAAGVTVIACSKQTAAPEPTPTEAAAPTATTAVEPTATPEPAISERQAPILQEQVTSGELPDLGERLAQDALIVEPIERIGQYGGDQALGTLGPSDGAIFTRHTEYENYVRWNPEWTAVVPGTMQSWEIQDGGKAFVLKLRKGMKWSDGEPFTADDVMFWYEEATNTDLNPSFPAKWSAAGEPAVVSKEDDYTVRFDFAEPYGVFLQQLATPGGELYSPRHYREAHFPAYADAEELEAKIKEAGVTYWYEAYGDWNAPRRNPDAPVTFGWSYTSVLGDGPTFIAVRNPYYWKTDPEGNQLPYVDRQVYTVAGDQEAIVMMAVAGEISFQARHIASLANKPLFLENAERSELRFVDVQGAGANSFTVILNLTHKDPAKRALFQNLDFRIALSHAINRQEIIDVVNLGQGTPWQSAPLPDSPLYNETLATQYTEYDPDLANQMLDEIIPDKDTEGFRLLPNGEELGIVIEVASNQQSRIDGLEMVKNYWADVGVRMAIKSEERSLLYERKGANEHDGMTWGSPGGAGSDVFLNPRHYLPHYRDPDFAVAWADWWRTGGQEGEEPSAAAKKQIELYEQLLITPGQEEQDALMAEVLRITQEEFWVIGTYRTPPGYAVVKKSFRNVPDLFWGSWQYPNPAPLNPPQFFFES
jgi:peptide/nickel transport system substrate-binding protein